MTDLSEQLSQQQKVERDELAKAFRHVLSDARGKRVLFWILEQCAIYQDAFSADNDVTNYTLGQQASGRKVIAQMDAIDPRLYPQLLVDRAEIRERDRAAAKAMAKNQEQEDDEE
jgi:hypothetical protein